MEHDVSLEEYDHEGALEHLIIDVLKQVVALRHAVVQEHGEGWEALDVQYLAAGYQVLLRKQEPDVVRGRYRYMAIPVSVLTLVLDHDLLSIAAVVAGYSADKKVDSREALAAGMRTLHSKRRGFRWGADYRRLALTQLVQEDINALAELLVDQDLKVIELTVDYETLAILTDSDSWLYVPFDHYPFLGEYSLRYLSGQADAKIVQSLNDLIEELWGAV